MSINRRQFVGGSAGVVAAVAAAGVAHVAHAEEAEQPDLASQVTETVDFDLVVVGSGPAGLSAGVQAAEQGLKVIMLEAHDIRGGALMGAEGMAAANSPLQQEQGIEFDLAEVPDHMASISEYKVNGLFWKNMIERSGDNIAWLIEHGVKFSGVVDDYKGDGVWQTFHWFEGDFACPTSLGDPMEAAFLSNEGCELRLNCQAQELKLADGKVAGVYATYEGGVLEVNAPAVILATGGYAANDAMVQEVYPTLHEGRYKCAGTSSKFCDGTGKKMALAAGAKETTDYATFMSPRSVNANFDDRPTQAMGRIEQGVWVNQDGVRFVREDCGSTCAVTAPLNALIQQRDSYVIVDAGIMESLSEQFPDGIATIEGALANGGIYEADDIAGLAEQIGVDADVLAATIETYNADAEAGKDSGFCKDPAKMVPLATPPFFAFYQIYGPYKILGATAVNVNYEVIDANDAPIPGLYAAGTEANMNYYKCGYSYHCAGGACAQAVDSGRVAANCAAAYIGA